MPKFKQGGTEYDASETLVRLHAVANRNLTGEYTPAGWARLVIVAQKLEATPERIKQVGGQFRQQLWRDSDNGVTRKGRYPKLSGAQIVSAIINEATVESKSKLHTEQAKILRAGNKVSAGAAKAVKAATKKSPKAPRKPKVAVAEPVAATPEQVAEAELAAATA